MADGPLAEGPAAAPAMDETFPSVDRIATPILKSVMLLLAGQVRRLACAIVPAMDGVAVPSFSLILCEDVPPSPRMPLDTLPTPFKAVLSPF